MQNHLNVFCLFVCFFNVSHFLNEIFYVYLNPSVLGSLLWLFPCWGAVGPIQHPQGHAEKTRSSVKKQIYVNLFTLQLWWYYLWKQLWRKKIYGMSWGGIQHVWYWKFHIAIHVVIVSGERAAASSSSSLLWVFLYISTRNWVNTITAVLDLKVVFTFQKFCCI